MVIETTGELVYAGFWRRVWANVIDAVLVGLIVYPIMFAAYGKSYLESSALVHGPLDFLFSWVLPGIATVLFWMYRQATPGKMAIGARIVDAKTGAKPSTGQFVGRYLAYYLSMAPFLLGFLWVGFDRRKQGWHDRLAGTVVVRRTKPRPPETVHFDSTAS